ncbi:unnamed protein product [Albugo candida]|uniref:Uncharacterized protein n=1 Tax=Albugo candida TaxID=65357 RepID=A0A024GP03_9STRA|nr:unnamed protein product [Albugo candida]|eukprot:CCI48437.1 unnamed protein product [Albugo candida]
MALQIKTCHNPSPDFEVQVSTSNTARVILVHGKVQCFSWLPSPQDNIISTNIYFAVDMAKGIFAQSIHFFFRTQNSL